MTGITVDRAEESSAPKKIVKNTTRLKSSETRLGSLIVKTLSEAGEPVLTRYVQDAIERQGFKPNSASSTLGDLVQEGVVKVDKSVSKMWKYSLA